MWDALWLIQPVSSLLLQDRLQLVTPLGPTQRALLDTLPGEGFSSKGCAALRSHQGDRGHHPLLNGNLPTCPPHLLSPGPVVFFSVAFIHTRPTWHITVLYAPSLCEGCLSSRTGVPGPEGRAAGAGSSLVCVGRKRLNGRLCT